MAASDHRTPIFILYVYFIASLPPQYHRTYYRTFSRRNHLKKQGFNKQYERKMTVDKRFRQNHTKYLRFKAFRFR